MIPNAIYGNMFQPALTLPNIEKREEPLITTKQFIFVIILTLLFSHSLELQQICTGFGHFLDPKSLLRFLQIKESVFFAKNFTGKLSKERLFILNSLGYLVYLTTNSTAKSIK